MPAKENVVVIYHIPTGEPRAVITDATPAMIASMNINNDPENHAHVFVPVDQYNSFNHHQFHQYLMNEIKAHKLLIAADTAALPAQ